MLDLLENRLKSICESHWLVWAGVNEENTEFKIIFRHKTHSIPFGFAFFSVIKEARYLGYVLPVKADSVVFLSNSSNGVEIKFGLDRSITLDMAQRNDVGEKDIVFVAASGNEYVLRRERE